MSGVLANKRKEQFCILYVQGKSNDEAFVGSGYKAKNKVVAQVCARRLLRETSIIHRIAELQRHAVDSTEVTVASLLRDISQVERDAMHDRNHSAAVAAITAKAKLAGLWVERTESENVNLNYVITDSLPTEQQWEEERAQNAQVVGQVVKP